MVRIVGIDRRGCRYHIGYYKSTEEARKWHDRVVNDKYWGNNSIHFVETFFEDMGDW